LIASLQQIPVVAPPGKVFGYSNQMYAAGGYLAAYLAGAAYESAALEAGYAEQLEQRVFDPIGMPRTGMLIAQFDTSSGAPHLTLGAPGDTGLEQVLELKRLGK
jgi:CubicO group peptidase (beta-lactamase class C family)